MELTPLTMGVSGLGAQLLQKLRISNGPVVVLLSSEFDISELVLDNTGRGLAPWLRDVVGGGYAAQPHVVSGKTDIFNNRQGFGVAFALSKKRPDPTAPEAHQADRDVRWALRDALDRFVTEVLRPEGALESDETAMGNRLLIAAIAYRANGGRENPFNDRLFEVLQQKCRSFKLRDVDGEPRALKNAPGWVVLAKWACAEAG